MRSPNAPTAMMPGMGIKANGSQQGLRYRNRSTTGSEIDLRAKGDEKQQKDIGEIDLKIISMYAKGTATRQISETLMDIYGFEASEGFISDLTDKLLP